MRRILTAAVLAPLLWMLIKIAPPWAFFAVAALVVVRSAWECYALLEARGERPFKTAGLAACLGVTWAFTGSEASWRAAASVVVVAVLSVGASLWSRDDPPAMLRTWLSTLFPIVFVGLALGHVVGLRSFGGADGEDLPLLLVFCIIASDTAAYYVGSAWGRHRLAPRVSPKKSWEGALGGVAASIGAAVLGHFWFYQRLPLGHAVVLGVLLAAGGILGDLAESVVKRAAGAKDASNLLPGHGGMLDRVDSLLIAGPVLYYYYVLLLGRSL